LGERDAGDGSRMGRNEVPEVISEERKARKKAYSKARNATPEGKAYNKARNKARNATPEGKAYNKAYNATPERKAYHKAYNATPEVKARKKARRATPEVKAYQKAYNARPGEAAKRNGIIAITWSKPSLCEACGKPERGGRSLSADHCHVTKLHRGWLCVTCNFGLAAGGDDLVPFKAWGDSNVRYLERFEHRDGYLK